MSRYLHFVAHLKVSDNLLTSLDVRVCTYILDEATHRALHQSTYDIGEKMINKYLGEYEQASDGRQACLLLKKLMK